MKKFFNVFLVLVSLFAFSCTNEMKENGDKPLSIEKETEVYINNIKALPQLATRSFSVKDELGYSTPIDGKYSVWYFIRIDGNIPGEGIHHYNSKDYFPRTESYKTLISDSNHGFVLSNVNWKSCSNFSKYIYSKDGSSVQSIIVEEPTIEALLSCNKGNGDDMNGYIEHKDELHFLWYVCKKQDSDHCWHIDGILTSKDRTDISQTDYGKEIIDNYDNSKHMISDTGSVVDSSNIEVDIHQQEHKNWDEIKTSVHIRNVSDIVITLPIEKEFICPSDDFAVRTYELNYESIDPSIIDENSSIRVYEDLKVTIEHKDNAVVISINGVTKEMLDNDNGEITIEIHSYYRNLMDNELWNKLKQSTVDLTNKEIILKGQIHSSLNDNNKDEWIIF